MKPIEFKEANCIFKGPPNSDIQDLAVFRDGQQLISCWHLTDEDLERIKESRRIYLGIMGQAMPPVYVTTENPFVQFKHAFSFCHVQYKSFEIGKETSGPIFKTIFVRGDISIPTTFKQGDKTWYLQTKKEDAIPVPSYEIKNQEWCFLLVDGMIKIRYVSNLIDDWVDVPISLT